MRIKTQFRINILLSIGLALVVGGILFYADRRIDREMEKNLLADRISKGVFELFMVSNTYLTYREERPRIQWGLKLASLRQLIQEAKLGDTNGDETFEILAQRCDQMGALFERIVSYAERLNSASEGEAGLLRDAFDRLTTNLTAKGQEMVNLAFLMIQDSNRGLSFVKNGAFGLVIGSILAAIAISGLISHLLSGRIVNAVRRLQTGTEVVAGGDLSHRLDVLSDDEIGQLAHAFNAMTHRLSESNAAMEREVSERVRAQQELKEYAARLERSNRELQDFAFVASHDLQEPLRKIRAFGDRLKLKWGDRLTEQGQDYVDRMQSAAVRMQAMIEALLHYSRVTTKREPFLDVDLHSAAQDAVSDLAVLLEETEGRVEVGELPTIVADPHQMRQLLQNLIANGLKFHGPEKPIVRVGGESAASPPGVDGRSRAAWCKILVEDNGIGFDEKYLDRIFNPFQRLHGRAEYEGAGIGLAICRKIAERHGGSITAKSVLGRGATFVVTLPLRQPGGGRG
jgi:signal transduction histidine kinase